MNSQPTTRLDSFETALLAELKTVVVTSDASPAQGRVDLRHWFRGRRPWYVAVAIAAVVAVVVTLAGNAVRPTPAFAVSGGTNGKVRVHVMRLEGAPALERALAERGIKADITYLPMGKKCAPGRYTELPTPGLMLSTGANDFTVTIPAGSMAKGDVFVMTAAVQPIPNGVKADVDFGIARGPVRQCEVVPR